MDTVLMSTALSFIGVILTGSTWISKNILEVENFMPCCQRLYEYVDLP